ncbi:TonB-dependent receptor [Rhodanobacter glycinis]|uniref:Outer membrane receptor proteins, mostly Fe transport n=1 Tax=Rhodanobacter glycinis TaxID=582702 RepID=A0A1I4ETK5_9GAMM|nr:TonB-dependent receptor [Rhodanobacter glycinis]SFL08639.1 Outer membrane receptor proteins, mostly Fe transport [Rhodanobacter glycinis]HEU0198693.1 TonB-dependent receptor [Nevskiaceae bacterium]
MMAVLVSCPALATAQVKQLGEVVVIGVTPLPGLSVPASQVPLNTQSAQADDISRIHGQSLTNLLEDNFQGVNITQSQGNPWQGNLYFHGFTLSPLLGSPSGISVYVDGVRQNEPFAGTMNWEAMPDFAIRNVTLIPSSNPLYGLNTLGGVLVLQTKSGFTDPGGSFDVSGGSWGRIQVGADFGVHGDHFAFYAGVGSDYESGWREFSPSRVRQVFLRGDWRPDDATDIALSYTGTHATLYGTQTIPVEWAGTPESAFTWPDYFINNLSQLNLRGSRQIGSSWSLQADAYLRISQQRGFDSNTNDHDDYDEDEDGPLSHAANGPFDTDSVGQYYNSGLAPAYDPLDPAATINNVPGSNVLSNVHSRGYGGSVQAVNQGRIGGLDNQFALGVSLDASTSHYDQVGQPAYFPYDVALRGHTLGLIPFGEIPLSTDAATGTRNVGVYFLDVLSLADAVQATVGGRYDYSRIGISDLTGEAPDINGRNTFHRFNPSLGLTWAVTHGLGAYINYDEGMRTPTPIELECASPEAPCTLPNAFTGDPPLKPVIAHTFSAGLRGAFASGHLHWNVSPYYSRVSNDILTIFTGGSSQGYFANVPKTVRKGVDVGMGGQLGRFEWQANYGFLEATYGAPFEERSGDNSSADDDGVIRVVPGDRLPGVPRHTFTLAARYHFAWKWAFGGHVRAYSGQYAVGDENNQDDHGQVPGYALLDLDITWQAARHLSLFAKVQNVFDRRYFISGQLSDNVFDTPQRLIDATGPGTSTLFVAPGAPRGCFVGLSYRFGLAGDDD